MNSVLICVHGLHGSSTGWRSSCSVWLGALVLWHISHSLQCLHTSRSIFGWYKFLEIYSTVLSLLKLPATFDSCSDSIILGRIPSGTYILFLSHSRSSFIAYSWLTFHWLATCLQTSRWWLSCMDSSWILAFASGNSASMSNTDNWIVSTSSFCRGIAPTANHCSFRSTVWWVAEIVPPSVEVNAGPLESISALANWCAFPV